MPEMNRNQLVAEIKSAASKNINFNIGYQVCKEFPHWASMSVECLKQCAESYTLLGFKNHSIKYLGMAQALADIIKERIQVNYSGGNDEG